MHKSSSFRTQIPLPARTPLQLFATVEAGDAAVKPSAPGTPSASNSAVELRALEHKDSKEKEHKIPSSPLNPNAPHPPAAHHVRHGSNGVPAAHSSGAAHGKELARNSRELAGHKNTRRSFQRSSNTGMKPVDSVVGAMNTLAAQVRSRARVCVCGCGKGGDAARLGG